VTIPLPPLTYGTLWAILRDELDDDTANQLVWSALGYHWTGEKWVAEGVEATWREAYPEPPNFIESRPATVKLTRSIAPEHKQLLKEVLGFGGYKIDELVPRKTRRATMVNWLLGHMQNG
jgi:Domain of unknown function (DUF1823)